MRQESCYSLSLLSGQVWPEPVDSHLALHQCVRQLIDCNDYSMRQAIKMDSAKDEE